MTKQALPIYSTFAIVSDSQREKSILRIPLTSDAQHEVVGTLLAQYELFNHSTLEKVSFEGGYNLENDEIFHISLFEIPNDIKKAIIQAANLPELKFPLNAEQKIKSIFIGRFESSSNSYTILFQYVDKSNILLPGKTLLFQGEIFSRLLSTALTLDSKLSAAIFGTNLYFRNYKIVNQFMDITEYYKEATDQEVESFLSHKILLVQDVKKIISLCDSSMRKRISLIDIDFLNTLKVKTIIKQAKAIGIAIEKAVDENGYEKIKFPNSKREIKIILKFMNEEIFRGLLSNQIYQANSKRLLG